MGSARVGIGTRGALPHRPSEIVHCYAIAQQYYRLPIEYGCNASVRFSLALIFHLILPAGALMRS